MTTIENIDIANDFSGDKYESASIDTAGGFAMVQVPVYNTEVPSTIDDMKSMTFAVAMRDYPNYQPIFEVADVSELQTVYNWLIDQIIINSKSTGDGDYSYFVQSVTEKYSNHE